LNDSFYLFLYGFIINLLVFFKDRVDIPLVKRAQGVFDCRPPEVFPPLGWSIGFIATPLTEGRLFNQRDLPAFLIIIFS